MIVFVVFRNPHRFFACLRDFSALAYAAQSIVAPIGGLTLVANILFGKFFLKELLTRKDVVVSFLVVVRSPPAVLTSKFLRIPNQKIF